MYFECYSEFPFNNFARGFANHVLYHIWFDMPLDRICCSNICIGDVTKTGNGEWGMGNGKLKMGN